MTCRFSDKVVVITGAASGMGAEEARQFHREGAKVVVTDLRASDGESLVRDLGEGAIFVEHDVSSESDWTRVHAFALQHFGRVNILVNNAAYLSDSALLGLDLETFRRHIDVNLFGTFLGMRTIAPSMRDVGGGVIVNVSSISGMIGHANRGAYAASKWAVRGLTKTAAIEWAPHRIRVCAIVPGPIDTPMSREARGFHRTYSLSDVELPEIPMRRFGRAEEVARSVLFLASDESSYTTGTELVVDGGTLLHR